MRWMAWLAPRGRIVPSCERPAISPPALHLGDPEVEQFGDTFVRHHDAYDVVLERDGALKGRSWSDAFSPWTYDLDDKFLADTGISFREIRDGARAALRASADTKDLR